MENLNEQAGDSSLQSLELKANLNPEQREYLEVLKDKMKKVLGGKTKYELAKAGDVAALKNYRAILTEILEVLKTKNIMARQIKNENLNDTERKQLGIISIAMKKNESNPDDDAREEILKKLNEQWDMIETRNWPAIRKDKMARMSFDTKFLFPVDELRGLISGLEASPNDHFLFTEQILDDQDNIFQINFEKIGEPQKKYNVIYKSFGHGGHNFTRIRGRLEGKRGWFWRDLAEYDEKKKTWYKV